jgi:hypothetical protein
MGPLFPLKKGQCYQNNKVMIVTDGNNLPLSVYVASAQPHEIRLAEKTLRGIRVPPQRHGRPKIQSLLLTGPTIEKHSVRVFLNVESSL